MKNGSLKKAKFTIGGLAKSAGVALTTVRYYQKRGLLSEPAKPEFGGVRIYGEADLTRLLQIRRAQELGFTLTEISVILANVDNGQCEKNQKFAAEKHKELGDRIRELQTTLKSLAEAARKCPDNCAGSCPLIYNRPSE